MDQSLLDKLKRLRQIISDSGKVAVAYSGGVDSSLLLKTAVDVLGSEVIALYAQSPLQLPGDAESVKELTRQIGSRLFVCVLDPFQWPDFVANPPDRCYRCKKKIYSLFLSELQKENGYILVDGTNSDDLLTDRPGLRAIQELGVQTPLTEANLNKEEIRRLSYHLGLPTWDKPSASCLATRIPTGSEISRQKVEVVGRCEKYLHSLGFFGCRVRLEGDNAKIELVKGDFERFTNSVIREKMITFWADLGIQKVFLDLTGRQDMALVGLNSPSDQGLI